MENWRRHIAKAQAAPAAAPPAESLLPYYRSDLRVIVRSVAPLSAEIVKAIADKVRRAYQREVLVEVEIDQALLGGLVVMIGHRVIDMSLATHLRRMSAQIAQRLEDVVKDLDAAWEKRLTTSMEEFLEELRRQAKEPVVWPGEPASGGKSCEMGDQAVGESPEVLVAAPGTGA